MSSEETYQYNLFMRDYERWKREVDRKLNLILEILDEESLSDEDSRSDDDSLSDEASQNGNNNVKIASIVVSKDVR